MAASAPLVVSPLTVTVLAVPAVLLAKAAAAELLFNVTVSPLTTPTREAVARLSVAVVLPS